MIYCLRCKEKTKDVRPREARAKNGRLMKVAECHECMTRKNQFIKEEQTGEGNIFFETLDKMPKLTGTWQEQVKRNYTGPKREGTAADVTNLVGETIGEVADRYVPGSKYLVDYSFGGLANAIQSYSDQKKRGNYIKSHIKAKTAMMRIVNLSGLSEANKKKGRSLVTEIYSDRNADVPVLQEKLRTLLRSAQ